MSPRERATRDATWASVTPRHRTIMTTPNPSLVALRRRPGDAIHAIRRGQAIRSHARRAIVVPHKGRQLLARHRAVARPADGRPYPASSRGGGFGTAPIASALNDLASRPRGLRELWPGERGRLPVLPPLRCAVLDCGTRARAAKDSDRAVLRSDRLDRARRVDRSGGSAGAAGPVLRADEGDRRVARRQRGEVHRRRRDGRVRRAGACTRTTRCARVRAAVEMRDALPELGVQGRIGVNTGEVVTGTEERLATGDAVNVAARLEQAAQPGEVLIGAPTLALVARRGRGRGGRAARTEGQGGAGRRLPAPTRAGGAGAAARDALRRPGARARAAPERLGAMCRRSALRAGDDRRQTPASASRASSPSSWIVSTLRSSAAAASPTARGSPTGRSSRC